MVLQLPRRFFEWKLKHLAAHISGGPCRYLQAQVAQVAGIVHDEDRELSLEGRYEKKLKTPSQFKTKVCVLSQSDGQQGETPDSVHHWIQYLRQACIY